MGSIKDVIKQEASCLGFAVVGITTASPVDHLAYLEEAVSAGRIGQMSWLARTPATRCDPRSLLPGAKSVICCAMAYGDDGIDTTSAGIGQGGPVSPQGSSLHLSKEDGGRIARFARGQDYHEVIRKRLEVLLDVIHERHPDARAEICVDTKPVLEKAIAARAGVGWIGKNTVLLNERGSWFVLGEIIIDFEIESDAPAKDNCGSCTACIDACPNGALIAPYRLDARRCISYLTIEANRRCPGVAGLGSRVSDPGSAYGCDLCQEACPYNTRRGG